MEKTNQEKDKETMFLRFSGDLVVLAEWVEEQTKAGGFRNRQDFVFNVLRQAKMQTETAASAQ